MLYFKALITTAALFGLSLSQTKTTSASPAASGSAGTPSAPGFPNQYGPNPPYPADYLGQENACTKKTGTGSTADCTACQTNYFLGSIVDNRTSTNKTYGRCFYCKGVEMTPLNWTNKTAPSRAPDTNIKRYSYGIAGCDFCTDGVGCTQCQKGLFLITIKNATRLRYRGFPNYCSVLPNLQDIINAVKGAFLTILFVIVGAVICVILCCIICCICCIKSAAAPPPAAYQNVPSGTYRPPR